MKEELHRHLRGIPRLDVASANTATYPCKICGDLAFFFDVVDFNKICSHQPYPFGPAGVAIPYHRCKNCRFIFTAFFDDWTNQEFSTFIYNEDYVKVDGEYVNLRPTQLAEKFVAILFNFKNRAILDFGTGAGVFAKNLRANGFQVVEGYDPYSSPEPPTRLFDVITCFEVIEHSPDPLSTLRQIKDLLRTDGIAHIQTGMQPSDIERIRANWWYIAPRNGHVSIFTEEALGEAAQAVGLQLLSDEHRGHWLSRRDAELVNPWLAALHLTPVYRLKLHAPSADHPGWHSVERTGNRRFRWTASETVVWPVALPSWRCIVIIKVPVLMSVTPNFLSETFAEIGGCKVPLQGSTYLEGRFSLVELSRGDESRMEVRIVTPSLLRPCDVGNGSDKRLLGIAVETCL